MFNMGLQEMIVLGAIALLVIGPKQLPEVARVVGRMLNEFKRATGDLTSSLTTVQNEARDLANQTQSYMHRQKAEFEKKMKEGLELDEVESSHHQEDSYDDLDEEFRPSHHDHHLAEESKASQSSELEGPSPEKDPSEEKKES